MLTVNILRTFCMNISIWQQFADLFNKRVDKKKKNTHTQMVSLHLLYYHANIHEYVCMYKDIF